MNVFNRSLKSVSKAILLLVSSEVLIHIRLIDTRVLTSGPLTRERPDLQVMFSDVTRFLGPRIERFSASLVIVLNILDFLMNTIGVIDKRGLSFKHLITAGPLARVWHLTGMNAPMVG